MDKYTIQFEKPNTKKLLYERFEVISGINLIEDNIGSPQINIEKIITHGGAFHADEFNIDEEEYENPNILVLDIGKKYEPEKSNLDHHQDSGLQASDILMYNWINDFSKYSVSNGKLYSLLEKISDCDVGKVICADDTFNAKIRFLNSVPDGYDYAVKLSEYVINNIFNGKEWYDSPEVQEIVKLGDDTKRQLDIDSEKLWNDPNVFKKEGRIAYRVNPEERISRVSWQDIESKKPNPVLYTLVGMGRDNNGYGVMSFDSKKYPILPNEHQTFLHNNRFYAIYDTMENAISHMREMT
jgi:hypothetical protein